MSRAGFVRAKSEFYLFIFRFSAGSTAYALKNFSLTRRFDDSGQILGSFRYFGR